MKENRISIIIERPIRDVFEYTTNPNNTHVWIPSIEEEVAEEYPPKIGTVYKNRGKGSNWNVYKVIEFEPNKLFTLKNEDGSYSVRYTYREIDENTTEMVYFELVHKGELEKPFTEKIFLGLKNTMEKQ
jgi:uncharacterized protein YndB with AHSA1/START domain